MNWELPDVQVGFRKGRETRDQTANICSITEKPENFRKISTSASLTTLKPLTVWITTNCGKFLKRWEYYNTLPVSWETCMGVKNQQLESYMNNWLIQNWERSTNPSADEWIRKLWYIYTMEYYSAVKKNTFESLLMRWMKLEPICGIFKPENCLENLFLFQMKVMN